MYLADSIFKKGEKRANVQFFIGTPVIFGAPPFREPLLKLIEKRGITANFNQDLVEIDADNFQATFKNVETGELRTEGYSLLHVTPKMNAPDFIRNSKLANEAGFVWLNFYAYSFRSMSILKLFSTTNTRMFSLLETVLHYQRQKPQLQFLLKFQLS